MRYEHLPKIALCCLLGASFVMGCRPIDSNTTGGGISRSNSNSDSNSDSDEDGDRPVQAETPAKDQADGPAAPPTGSEAEQIKAGKMIFVKASCWGCHPHGENSMNGDKPLKGANFKRKYKTDNELTVVIRRGNEKMGMPPFPQSKLSDGDLKQIIVFVRSLSSDLR